MGSFHPTVHSEDEIDAYFYEGVAISVAGTAQVPWNNNRNSTKTPTATFDGIVNASVGDANADTDITGANLLAHRKVGANRVGGSANHSQEFVLRQGTIYCMRIVFTKAAYVVLELSFYEHTNKAQVTGQPWSR